MSKVKVTRTKNGIVRPFRRPACSLCLVKTSVASSFCLFSLIVDHFSGRVEQSVGSVCACVCVESFQTNDL